MPNAWANAAVPPGTGTSSETTDAADGGARTSATNAATRDAASGRYTEPYFPPASGQVEPRPSRRGHIIYAVQFSRESDGIHELHGEGHYSSGGARAGPQAARHVHRRRRRRRPAPSRL